MLRRQAHSVQGLATSASAEETARPNNYRWIVGKLLIPHPVGMIQPVYVHTRLNAQMIPTFHSSITFVRAKTSQFPHPSFGTFGKLGMKVVPVAMAVGIAIAALTGCATHSAAYDESAKFRTSQAEVNARVAAARQKNVGESRAYISSMSYASNLVSLMGIGRFVSDEYVPADQMERLVNAGKFDATDKALSYVGTSWISGAPFSFGNILFLMTPTPTEDLSYLKEPIFMGFMPKESAATAEEAWKKFQYDVVLKAFSMAAAEMGYEKEVGAYYLKFQRGKTADHDAGEILVKLDFQSKGALHPAHEMAVPQWISQREEISWAVGVKPSWRLTTETLSVYRGEGFLSKSSDLELKMEFLDRFAKYLPKNCFVFVPSFKKGGDSKERTAPYVAGNQRKYYFVMTKAE